VVAERLISYKASAETRSVKVNVGTQDLPIKAMTAHGSKGLEFDHVFIPYATEESWVGRARGSYFVLPNTKMDDDELKDIRRLFYVALTRARKHVSVVYSLEDTGGVTLTPLRFISEIEDGYVARVSLPVLKEEVVSEKNVNRDDVRKKQFVEYAQHALITRGLSVTALNNFIKCPSYFLYQSILKLPQAPAANAEKGNAMHRAFDAIWKSKDRNESTVLDLMRGTIISYFETTSLPSFEKDAVVKDLLENVPQIARSLHGHFAQEGKVFSESWSEMEFSSNYNNETVVLSLHGKLDVILEQERDVLVFDYKTKQGMTVAAIKGETKSSDGNYFRQLIFYKMLLQHDGRFDKKHVVPALVFAMPNSKGECPIVSLDITADDIAQIKKEVEALVQSVWSGKIIEEECDDLSCEWCKLKRM
jgi:DNA helicase II / ATP-dependent DNA helicase PcrA